MNTYDMDERISTVAVTLGRIGTGDLVPLIIFTNWCYLT